MARSRPREGARHVLQAGLDLADELNRSFKAPLVETASVGIAAAGRSSPSWAFAVAGHYRAIELQAAAACALHLGAPDRARGRSDDSGTSAIATKLLSRVADDERAPRSAL